MPNERRQNWRFEVFFGLRVLESEEVTAALDPE